MKPYHGPIGPKIDIGHGYSYQVVNLTKQSKYVKLWHKGVVIDRALSVASARRMKARYLAKQALI